MPPFQIPKNRSKKSQREQLSKVLAFVKYERNIRAAEGCTVMPIPTTNKHMLAITGSPANASNLIKFMCKIGLISPESEKYRFGSRYEKNNYAKTYRYYYDNEQELLAYCEQEGIGEFSTKNCTRRKDAAIPDNLQISVKDVAISSHLKLMKPEGLSHTEFEDYVSELIYQRYPHLEAYQELVDEINETHYSDYPEFSISFRLHFTWDKKKNYIRKIGLRATNSCVSASNSEEHDENFHRLIKQELLNISRPNIFSVEAGYLRCQSLWGIEIDNEHKDMVSVYLGDLGRDLPVQEHSHWKQYNIATDARLSTNAVKRDFLCAFTQPEISDLKFKSNFKQFVNTWREQYQWDLFLPLSQNDEYNFKTLHLPITDGQEEFDHLVLSLVKTMIDSLNEKEIVKQFKNPTDLKGGISKLEYWLSELNFPDYQQQIKFLRNLQELRSTGTGHRKGKGHEKAAGVFGLNTDNYVDVFDRILLQANAFILFLAKNFLKDWTVTLS